MKATGASPKVHLRRIEVNPPLTIEGTPEETKSLVLIIHDPGALIGTLNHWLMWNIPPTTKIEEGSIPRIQRVNTGESMPTTDHVLPQEHTNISLRSTLRRQDEFEPNLGEGRCGKSDSRLHTHSRRASRSVSQKLSDCLFLVGDMQHGAFAILSE